MFKKFNDYMWYLIHAPLKAKKNSSDIYILFKVIGIIFDDLKSMLVEIKKQGNILTAEGKFLDLCGKDRNMLRFQNEDDESYRKRLLMKVEIAKRAGTEKGMQKALDMLGCNADIEPLYLTDAKRWAEFYVILNENIERREVYSFDVIKQTVMEIKQASAKPNFGFRFVIDFNNKINLGMSVTFTMQINFYSEEYLYLDDSWCLDGQYNMDGVKNRITYNNSGVITIQTGIKNSSTLSGEVEYEDDWCLDGSYMLDGSKCLMSGVWKEELD